MQRWHKILLAYFSIAPFCQAVLQATVCKSHLSSAWYAQDPQTLSAQLARCDKAARDKQNASINKIQAMVVPHAGLSYSGDIAASCWRLVKKQKIKRVIILAPSHTTTFHGVLLPTCSSFEVPLGMLKVDETCINKLAQQKTLFKQNSTKKSIFINDPFYHEHALEMQLLFCSYYVPDVQIVPLIVGTLTPMEASSVAMYLKDCADNYTLVVVSSDFVHYGPEYDYEPFAKDAHFKNNLTKLTNKILSGLLVGSSHKPLDAFVSTMRDTQVTICGKNPLMVLLGLVEKKVFEGAEPYVIGYGLSDQTNTKPNCVSYVGIVWGDSNGTVLPTRQLTEE